jgi:hypothetical protein
VVNGDITDESDETFVLNLSNAVNATIGDDQGIGMISDDDGPPSISIADCAIFEGNSGSVDAVFSVHLTGTSTQTVMVDYATADGSAATADNDYVAISGQMTFQPGEDSVEVTIVVNGDVTLEPHETFVVDLSNAVNATIADEQGTGTILNDDGLQDAVTVSFQDDVGDYTGTRDAKLLVRKPTTNFGTALDVELDGAPLSSGLLSWDLTSLPAGIIIQSVDIAVNIINGSSEDYEFYQVLRPWVEREVTWNVYASGMNWQTPGAAGSGDYASTALARITGRAGPETVPLNSAGLVVVQSWVDDPATNHGFILVDYVDATDGLDFSSREHETISERPKLTITYVSSPVLSVKQELPREPLLSQNYPNPFNPTTRISYSVPDAGFVTLKIYDTLGREVQTSVNAFQVAGTYTVFLDASALSIGTYFYRLRISDDFVDTKKMLFIK